MGIDPISTKEKVCNFDCIYCQLGKTKKLVCDRHEFVSTHDLIEEIKLLPESLHIDYFTFSGRGEPTLAKNLGHMIKELHKIRKEKIAVITNSSLMHLVDVQMDLSKADFVLAKLDVCSQETLNEVGRAMHTIEFKAIVNGIISFKKHFHGKLALQVMFVHQNKASASEIAKIVRKIKPHEVHLNTPLRPSSVKPLSREELGAIEDCFFKGLPVTNVFEVGKKEVEPFDKKETVRRHGYFK